MDAIQAGIREAQLGELLAHSMEGFLHTLSSNGLCGMRQESPAVAAGIDDEPVNVEVGRDLAEVRVLREGGGESHP